MTGISPSTALAGTAGFTLTVTGTGFLPGTTVNWNGAPLATTFVSSAQITAAVPAGLIAAAGTAAVTAATPAPGGGVSAAKTFTSPMPP